MQYTLDSLRHCEEALRAENPNFKIHSNPVIWTGAQLKEFLENPEKAFFGVFTVHPDNNCFLSYRGVEIMKVDGGSQIIECFTAAEFLDLDGLPVADPKGLFRGFEIQILY